MSEAQVDTEVVDSIASRFETDQKEFLKAGLFSEGMFKWEVESMIPGVSDFDGVKQDVIVGRLAAVAKANYVDGELAEIEDIDPPKYKTHRFKIKEDSGKQQILTLYKAVTGRTPTGRVNEKGRFTLNQLQLAEECVGGSAWNTIYHFEPEGKNESFAVLGKKFSKQPYQRYGKKAKEEESED